MTNSTPTQDQLKAEFFNKFNPRDYPKIYHKMELVDLWHWITTVYEPKVREEERLHMALSKLSKNLQKLEKELSQLPTPAKDHE